ncbi:helix-turn-helix domain-containing protein [Haloactinomyces albus]|uniref:Excisionase family DNA binding protein n=1 Tax=Haloactinomyces albus TaxID=1352928 RepID=A0AAE3ZGY2_9ACTN|nr:helix-turn-helix domain-containing protein [Haloactinomyces albus]MDR7301826.1 excisionase family DNA binding protein [Haloactinomyces albus]MDR7304731.1 excisionase family DNA binding protein [Haloactinomyces albus]
MQVNGTATRMYRVKAVAEVLDVHVSTVYRLAESGRLHSVRVGFGKGALRIPADSLNAYLHSLGMAPMTDAEGAIA